MSKVVEVDLAGSFLRSALVADSHILPLDEFRDWFRAQRRTRRMSVRQILFADLDQWYLTEAPSSLAHRSGKFFSIEGLRIETDFGPVAAWSQPIIRQPEIGILGVITRMFDGVRHFLVQAKIEPGNINGLQLSPTEQATRSNYTRVHGGTSPPYHEYFVEPGRARILVDRLQGEQGSRFLRKRNRNMIVEVEEEIPLRDGFCWLTLGQIKRLLRQDNLVNMDLRSVLSCISLADSASAPLAGPAPSALLASLGDRRSALNTEGEILNWLTDLKARYHMKLERLPVDHLEQWRMSDYEIRHETGRYFSVIAVEVEAVGREVVRWSQPLLDHSGRGLNGFLMQRINGVLHFLVRACMYPGNCELFELGSTVSRSNADEHFGKPDAPAFLNLFDDPPQSWVRYAAVQSEEGGRFYHYQNRYVVLELPQDLRLELPENFCWMTLGQIEDFVRHGYFNIEGRNLLACIDFSEAEGLEGEPV
jgi:dTDP-4-dehydro-6-deoxy-alpha-D-glucopyranose 2,3-dehydratase